MRAHLKALIALVVAGTAAAQTGHTKPSTGATGKGSGGGGSSGAVVGPVAGIARPTVFVIPGNSSLFAPPGSFFANVPIIVVPDGRVFADFGRGFEQITRGCGFSFGTAFPPIEQPTTVQPVVIQPPVVVNQSPPPPAFTPNIPVPQPAVPVPTVSSLFDNQPVVVNTAACLVSNGRGQIFVARP